MCTVHFDKIRQMGYKQLLQLITIKILCGRKMKTLCVNFCLFHFTLKYKEQEKSKTSYFW